MLVITMILKTNAIATIAGMRGSGKTSLAKRILAMVKGDVIVYDPMWEYDPKISFHPHSDSKADFDRFMSICWDRGNLLVCVDEAERYFRVKRIMPEYATKVVNTGRHRNIGLLVITRRLAELNKTVFGLSETAILFQMFLPNDIRYIKDFYGEGAEDLRGIGKYRYKVFSMGFP